MPANQHNLVIIESPNKIKTIQKYLDKSYEIIATVGHIRDIPTSNFKAFDKETYEPHWEVITKPKSKRPIIAEIRAKAKQADKIFLASDPDREGEAISWHVFDILDKQSQSKCSRITFNEITKEAILQAIKNERQIQFEWVQSQFARRIIDRIVGYDLSRFVHNQYSGISAGRVQSVVLKFLYDREIEIRNFIPIKWCNLDVTLSNDDNIILKEICPQCVNQVKVLSGQQKQTSGVDFCSLADAQIVKDSLGKEYDIIKIDPAKQIKHNPKDPYKTSSLQQDAVNILGFSLAKATSILQDLYEGISVNGEPLALITYPRTDSTRMAHTFVNTATKYIEQEFGYEYVSKIQKVQKEELNVQNAHECIRPINVLITPESIKNSVNPQYYAMYKLIWQRCVASLMAPSIVETTTIWFNNNQNKFYTANKRLVFDGYRRVYCHDMKNEDEDVWKEYNLGQKFTSKKVQINEHETSPQSRYTQASLIKVLDESGVGRPSTYRLMADIGLSRGYCKLENKMYYVTEIGFTVIEGLIKYFSDVIDCKFTSDMEQRLDKIADKQESWNGWIIDFVPQLQQKIRELVQTTEKKQPEVQGRTCPQCGGKLIYRFSKKTKKQFIGCNNWPKCNYVEQLNKSEKLQEKCPLCGGDLMIRYTKRNKKFIGCSNWPKCKYLRNLVDNKQNKN